MSLRATVRAALRAALSAAIAVPVLTVAAPPPAGAASPLPDGFQDVPVLTGLHGPTQVRFAPDGRVFVAEKSGRVKVFDSLTDPFPTVFADLRRNVHGFWDRGLLGIALSPDFASDPWLYVLYTHDAAIGGTAPRWGTAANEDACPSPPGPLKDGCVVSGRLSRLAAGGRAAGPEQVLIEDWCQQYPSHSVGSLVFAPDGALYVTAGDGASYTFADHGQGGGSAGSPVPVNPCGDPPSAPGTRPAPPTAEGGALRAQDLRTPGDPVGLSGTVVRVDPATGRAAPGNPRADATDPNEQRIVAHGLRNPYRATMRPGTDELWLANVGYAYFEEIERIAAPTAGPVRNFGWPCYEGRSKIPAFDALDLKLCEDLYAEAAETPAVVTAPFAAFGRNQLRGPDGACGAGATAIAGLAFYTGERYPARFRNALFFADYPRRCIWAMLPGADGVPDPTRLELVHRAARGPVDLVAGPDGDLFYVDHDGGTIRRLRYAPPQTRFLSALEPTYASNGLGPYERDRAVGTRAPNDGAAIRIGGVAYGRGLGTHAPVDLRFSVGTCDRFRATIGVDDAVGDRGSVVFRVEADGEGLFTSDTITGASPPVRVDVDIRGRGEIRLTVLDAGDGTAADHADWADARFVCGPAGASTRPSFLSPRELASGRGASGVTAADLDRDGWPDLVVANMLHDVLSVHRGTPGRAVFASVAVHGTGAGPRAVTAADVDLDGRPDVVTADERGNALSVFLGRGDGTFHPRTAVATCAAPREVAVGRIDADAFPDLAVACAGSGGLAVLHRGSGGGAFRPRQPIATAPSAHSVAIGDLDRDGRTDVAIAARGANTALVARGRGDGTFAAASSHAVGQRPHAIRIADVDRDGRPDLLTANDVGNDVSVLLGRGDGTFRVGVRYGVGPRPRSLAIADLDGDGVPDIVTGTTAGNEPDVVEPDGDNVAVLVGRGDGTFGGLRKAVVGRTPFGLVVRDLDRDGRPDVVTANHHDGSVGILLNGTGDRTRFVSALPVSSAVNGLGPFERDRSNGTSARDGRPITLAGITYSRGLGTHAASDLRFDLADPRSALQRCRRFRAAIGVDDEVGAAGSVVFVVEADGRRLFTSPRLSGASATRAVDLDISGRRHLRLVVLDGGDGTAGDHADWANARLLCDA